MYKKIMKCLFLSLFLINGLLSAWTPGGAKGLDVNGIIGNNIIISIEKDYVGSYAFSLDVTNNSAIDDKVQDLGDSLTNKTGIRIASWSMQSNSAVSVTVSHDYLVHEIDSTAKINYNLGVQVSSSEILFCESSDDNSLVVNKSYPNVPVAIMKYGLFVRLKEKLSQYSRLPSGYYYSTITISVQSTN